MSLLVQGLLLAVNSSYWHNNIHAEVGVVNRLLDVPPYHASQSLPPNTCSASGDHFLNEHVVEATVVSSLRIRLWAAFPSVGSMWCCMQTLHLHTGDQTGPIMYICLFVLVCTVLL